LPRGEIFIFWNLSSYKHTVRKSNSYTGYRLFYTCITVNTHTFTNSSVIIPIRGAIDRKRHRKKFIAPDKEEKTYVGRYPIDMLSNVEAMSTVIKVDATEIIFCYWNALTILLRDIGSTLSVSIRTENFISSNKIALKYSNIISTHFLYLICVISLKHKRSFHNELNMRTYLFKYLQINYNQLLEQHLSLRISQNPSVSL